MPRPKPEQEILSESQRRAAVLLASGKRGTDIIEDLGIDSSTLSRWKRDPEFVAMVDGLLNQMCEEAIFKIRGLITKAVDRLEQILDDPQVNPRDRLQAIDRCLELAQFQGYQVSPEFLELGDAALDFLGSRYDDAY